MDPEPRPIMTLSVTIAPEEITELRCPYGAVSLIPFAAQVDSPLFTGRTVPGAVDVQQEDAAGQRQLCARYMLRGTDRDGNACLLFIENVGSFRPAEGAGPVLHACPRFLTDSPVLAEYLCQPRFRSEVHPSPEGVEIRIFDTIL